MIDFIRNNMHDIAALVSCVSAAITAILVCCIDNRQRRQQRQEYLDECTHYDD